MPDMKIVAEVGWRLRQFPLRLEEAPQMATTLHSSNAIKMEIPAPLACCRRDEISLVKLGEVAAKGLKRDEIGLNRHRALALCLSMIFSEPLFRIMLLPT
jgi:hypothetical protein